MEENDFCRKCWANGSEARWATTGPLYCRHDNVPGPTWLGFMKKPPKNCPYKFELAVLKAKD